MKFNIKKINVEILKKETSKFYKKFKKFSKNYMKTNLLFGTFLTTSIINVTLLRFFTVSNYFDLNPIIADIAIIIIIGSFGYYIKPKHQFKYFFTWSIFFTTLCITNSMYYTNYLSFASVSLLATSMQIIDVSDAVLENVIQYKDFIYLWQVVAILFVHRKLVSKNYYEKAAKIEIGKIRAINTLIVGGVLVAMFISTLNTVDIGRLSKQWNREFVVMRFGILTYQLNDALSTLRAQITPMFGYDKNAKLFREYYDNKIDTQKKNSYTNIFEGKNLIMIHAESIQTFALDLSFNGNPVAPFLQKLSKEGLYFSNFYSQESVGTSSDTEFTLATSLMPTTSGTVFVNYFDRKYVSIQQMLKEKDYYTFSMHGNNRNFWNRSAMHSNLGYNRFFAYPEDYTIDESIGLGLSDVSFFNQSIPKIKQISEENKNFFGTMIMLSNHTPFSDIVEISDYEVDYKYEKINEETNETEIISAPYMEDTKLGNYFKSVNYADKAIELFLESLEQEGILDNTVIVIYGDHDAKLRRSEYLRLYNYDPFTDSVLSKTDPEYRDINAYEYELNRNVPFIIWSKDKQFKKEITTVMGMYDVLPTLGNMFGIKSPYALGNDMFSIDENVVVFPNGNWLTNKMYYNVQKEEAFSLNEGETISFEYIDKYNKHANDVISVSDAIIIYDLIRKTEENKAIIETYGG
jgi:lipoteichoic acid synthase